MNGVMMGSHTPENVAIARLLFAAAPGLRLWKESLARLPEVIVSGSVARAWRPCCHSRAHPGGAAVRAGRRRDVDLELAHQSQEVRSLEAQRPGGTRAIASGLRQGRLDESALEVGDGAVEARRLGIGGGGDGGHAEHDRKRCATSGAAR